MSNKITNIIAALLLAVMFIAALTSSVGDSPTMDELAHIPAGYSYLSQMDYRINQEHPPLIKDVAAIPLLFLNLNFPKDHSSWTKDINGQWELGRQFLYNYGNDADEILFWARFPMILVLILLGFFLFYWTRKLGGNKAALIVLALFSFSPAFIAHGRLVTTDIGASLGLVAATFFWLKFLKNPINKNVIYAGLTFGAAMLLKFSLVLLIPFFVIITFVFALLKDKEKIKNTFKYIKLALAAAIIGAFLIWPIYQFHLLNYPPERQLNDTQLTLVSNSMRPLADLTIWMADKPGLRPYAQYMLGLLMATQRTASGNTTYFLGMVSAASWWYYFPAVYLLKIPLAFHILTLISLLTAAYSIKKPFWQKTKDRTLSWIKNHFTEFSMFVFLAIYWFTSIMGNLNIGLRHILPVFPFTYILVSLGIIKWLESKKFYKKIIVSLLLSWYMASSLMIWPSYITYFNEIIGGSKNGYKYAVDSNYDWGQDLKRLAQWTDEKGIEKIYIDYFGGGDTKYYLKEKYNSWWGSRNKEELPEGSYLAVSATMLQGGRAIPVNNFDQPTDYYNWLNNYEPVARVGNSIFVYFIP